MNIRDTVITVLIEVIAERTHKVVIVTDDLRLQDTGLDSLGVATLFASVEEKLHLEPFDSRDSRTEITIPSTVGELIALFEHAASVPHDAD